jgi:hypothetical protein
MAIIEYRASPVLPCHVPKMKRAALEDLVIGQMETIIDLQGELMAVKNVAHRTATKLAAEQPRKVRLPPTFASNDYPGMSLLDQYDVLAALKAAGVEVEVEVEA